MATRDTCATLKKVAPDEPIFVLRAQDELSHLVVRYWSMLAEEKGCPTEKTEEALRCAEEMRRWPTRKTPD